LRHCLSPRLGVAHLEHAAEQIAGRLALIEVAGVQISRLVGGFAHGLVELELRDVAEEVADVRCTVDHVRFRPGVEVFGGPGFGRDDAYKV
jgi:hypothetical protein